MWNKAYVDLNVLRSNAKKVKSKLKKGVKFCAVVKADGYGHGACEVASALYLSADCFAVALVEEGVALRRAGIDKDVLVLTPPFKQDVSIAVKYNLTLTVAKTEHLYLINAEAKRQSRLVKVQLKFNTGMNRQGLDTMGELKHALDYIVKEKHLLLDGMYSHLACPENKNVNNKALNKFLLANNLVKGYNNNAVCHISASGGFIQGIFADMVRIGILLYGYKPFPTDLIKVQPVMKIYAPILNTRLIKKGESALYGINRANEDVELSLIRYGYADGLFRKQTAGQFNKRCMDVTAIENAVVTKKGVPVMTDADKLAREYGTISYEILTKSAFRAEKIYLR